MNQKLINFFQFNNHKFEELSLANSDFVMQEKEFFNNNFLLASEGPIKQPSSKSLPEGYIELSDSSLFDRIKKKIVSFFKPKSQVKTFKVEPNSIVQIGDDYPTRPFYSFFSNIGSKMVDITEKIKTNIKNSKVNNNPLVYSESLVPLEEKKAKVTDEKVGLLGESIKDANFIIPNEVQEIADSTPEPSIHSSDKVKHVSYKSQTKGLHNKAISISSSINRHHSNSVAAISKYKGSIDSQTHDSIDRTVLPEINTYDKSEH